MQSFQKRSFIRVCVCVCQVDVPFQVAARATSMLQWRCKYYPTCPVLPVNILLCTFTFFLVFIQAMLPGDQKYKNMCRVSHQFNSKVQLHVMQASVVIFDGTLTKTDLLEYLYTETNVGTSVCLSAPFLMLESCRTSSVLMVVQDVELKHGAPQPLFVVLQVT